VASIVCAAGWTAETYWYYQLHQNLVRALVHGGPSTALLDPHYRLRMAGGISIVVVLLLAGAGFWLASGGTRASTESIEVALPVP